MSTSKQIDKICCGMLVVVLTLTVFFCNAQKLGVVLVVAQAGYASELFDDLRVHTIDIVMEDWDSFIENCESEEYSPCTAVIDGEAYKNIGIRAKGNTSLSSVAEYGNNRYSFKLEFDCYESGKTYHGLDKISLNNIIQDNTYMKDYMVYRMMREFGVASPLCSYVFINVNGREWGLYLAVEGVEESFLARNYGSDYGNLYKPDSMDMGGGRKSGEFAPDDMKNFTEKKDMPLPPDQKEVPGKEPEKNEQMQGPPDGLGGQMLFSREEIPDGKMSMESNDVALIYSNDNYESYKNIFDHAKTNISNGDKDCMIASLKALADKELAESVVDAEAVMRYFVVHNFVCNFDSYTGTLMHNYYLYEKDGKLSMIPWDYNLAFGGFESLGEAEGMVNYPIDTPVSGTMVEARPMLAWIFADEENIERYHQYFAEFIDEYFSSGYFEKIISEVQTLIAPYVEKDPTKFCTYEEFEKGVTALKCFCLLRATSIRGQLAGEIPATAQGQAENQEALIDAEGIALSDMGSMDRKGRGSMDDRKGKR